MTKNFDLKWAREHVGLTQAAAADKIGVSRVTFARWEAGTVQIPNAKFQRFLEAIELDPKRIPAQRKYAIDGYPVGFAKSATGDTDEDMEIDAERLKELEGKEYTARERVRYEYFLRNSAVLEQLGEAYVLESLAEFDAETERLKSLASVTDLI